MSAPSKDTLGKIRNALWGHDNALLVRLCELIEQPKPKPQLFSSTASTPPAQGEVLFGPIKITGAPMGKQRPKVVRRGEHAHAITPQKTRNWEAHASILFEVAWQQAPIDEPVVVCVTAVKGRPKNKLRKKDPDGRMWRTVKPDGDNVLKCVGDALVQGGIVRDDVVIVDWRVVCLYAARDEGPSVEVMLRRAPPTPPSLLTM
jgi:Holliday junction resolvase RusA-like endonuclease